jgi:ribonuclease HII
MLEYEEELYKKGITLIAGVDEVGRGPLVGPVVTAAVILPKGYCVPGINDSKKLSEKKREYYYNIIMHDAISIGIGVKDNKVIDEVNIYEATKLAMYEAISKLNPRPEHVLIDAMPLDLEMPSTSIIKGDSKSECIAAASIIAKVTRDHMMYELDKKFPKYGFAKHKGYPTKEHIQNVEKYGVLDNYRFTFRPISDLIKQGGKFEGKIRKSDI